MSNRKIYTDSSYPVNKPYLASDEEDGKSFDIRLLLRKSIHYWYLFVICITISVGIAMFVVLRTTPTFSREVKMLIKDDNSNQQGFNIDKIFGKSKVNVENETRAIRNTILTREVALRLGLQNSYWVREGLRETDLYKESPVQIMVRDANNDRPFSMKLEIKANGDIKIWDVETKDDHYSEQINAKFGETITLPNRMIITLLKGKNINKYTDQTITFKHKSLQDVADKLVKDMSIYVDGDNLTVVRIVERGNNKDKLDDILMQIMNVYNEQWLEDKNRVADATSQFIDERLQVIEHELGNVDSDISQFKSENLVPDLETASTMFMNQSNESDRAIYDLSNQISMAKIMRQELHKGGIDQILPATSGISNVSIQQMLNEFNQMVLERNRLLSTSTEKNPLVTDLTNELRPMRQNILRSLDTYISTLTSQMGHAEARMSQSNSKIAASPKLAKNLLSVERQQKVKESLYLYLLQKREENQLGKAFTAYNTRVIETPGPSDEPSSPQTGQALIIAFAIGFLVPLGGIYASSFFDNKVRTKQDIKDVISAPYLGDIPEEDEPKNFIEKYQYKFKKLKFKNKKHNLVIDSHSRNAINEAFRVARTNLEFVIEAEPDKKNGGNVISITSANPGSGKTFITINLGAVMAIKQHKVCVVDLDLRRGSLSKFAGSQKTGLTDYLAGKASSKDIVMHNVKGRENLDLIPIGSVPPNPAELLGSEAMKKLIDELQNEYEYVLLDCPPVEIVTDALIINRFADRTIFVVRAGLLTKDLLPEIEDYYRNNRYKNLAVILNGTDKYGGYGYNRYGYDYSEKNSYGLED